MKKSACLVVGLLGLGCASLALAATQVYKWTDENGIVHYSEAPPSPDSKQKATTLTVHAQPADGDASSMAPAASGSAKPTAGSGKSKAPPAQNAEERAQMCDELKTDLSQLDSHGRVRIMGDDGNVTALSDDAKETRRKEDQTQIDKYCSGN